MSLAARFLASYEEAVQVPATTHNELAFLGRSNVGKSSLINALTNHKNLAKSSSTPGKTRLINFFEISIKKEEGTFIFHLIDLPGFGYAKVSKKVKQIWNKNMDEFLRKRERIKIFLHLIDSRHLDLKIDEEVDEYLASFLREDQRLIRIFTKADKLNQSQRTKLRQSHPKALLISSTKKQGLAQLREELFGGGLGEG